MRGLQRLLASAVGSIAGRTEERSVASLFSPGGTHALRGEFAGSDDFEVAIECGSNMVRVGSAIFGEAKPGEGEEAED